MNELSVNLRVDPSCDRPSEATFDAERQLMQRVASGDNVAMEELVGLYGEPVARLVGRLLAWHADCDDVFQEVLLAAWRNADKYNGSGTLEGWLKRIAINRCRNHHRALSAWRRKLEQLVLRLGDSSESTGSVYSQTPGGESELGQALASLSPDDRTAIVMFHLEGYRGDEVARELNITTATLHVRLHRIRKRLKQQMNLSNE